MTLPKTKHPIFEIEVPSTKKKVYYRQMIVSDEKILLMAKASEDESDIYRAVKQVVNNCLIDCNIEKFTTFDIEFIFLKIRAASIGNIIELSFSDMQDENEYKFTVNLDDVEMVFPENVESLIKINEDTAIQLRYPPATLFDEPEATGPDSYEFIASKCIDKIFVGDDVFLGDDEDDKELLDYIHNMNTKSYQQLKDFISMMPRLQYIIEYDNKEGTKRKLALTTLTDFFTLR